MILCSIFLKQTFDFSGRDFRHHLVSVGRIGRRGKTEQTAQQVLHLAFRQLAVGIHGRDLGKMQRYRLPDTALRYIRAGLQVVEQRRQQLHVVSVIDAGRDTVDDPSIGTHSLQIKSHSGNVIAILVKYGNTGRGEIDSFREHHFL